MGRRRWIAAVLVMTAFGCGTDDDAVPDLDAFADVAPPVVAACGNDVLRLDGDELDTLYTAEYGVNSAFPLEDGRLVVNENTNPEGGSDDGPSVVLQVGVVADGEVQQVLHDDFLVVDVSRWGSDEVVFGTPYADQSEYVMLAVDDGDQVWSMARDSQDLYGIGGDALVGAEVD
ncbi:MAG: hypothetical protein KDB21_17540, partial [Acidimicrobiales bacterium]|nr:hypothetical protein [Acidimicrobiales bacterium]